MTPAAPLPDFDSLWDYDRPDATESEFRLLLPVARSSGNCDYLAQLLTQVARAQGLQMKFNEAAQTLDEATRTLDEAETGLAGEAGAARVRLLLERGRVLNSSKRRDESKALFREAWELARRVGTDGFAVDAAHMLGIVETGDASVDWNQKALALAESSKDPRARRWLGSLYNNLGWTRHDGGEPAAALDLFQKSLAASEAEGNVKKIHVARWSVARALRSLGRLDEALSLQRRLLAEGTPDGYVHEEIAECLLARGEEKEAAPHFAAAFEALSSDRWLQRDEPGRLERMRLLSKGVSKRVDNRDTVSRESPA
jgi:tetratricopeptide (TPR) repeat protein